MHETWLSKATSVLALLYAVRNAGIEKADVEYVLLTVQRKPCGEHEPREVAVTLQKGGQESCRTCKRIRIRRKRIHKDRHALIEAKKISKIRSIQKRVAVTAEEVAPAKTWNERKRPHQEKVFNP